MTKKEQIVAFAKQGMKPGEIAKKTGSSMEYVYRHRKAGIETGRPLPRPADKRANDVVQVTLSAPQPVAAVSNGDLTAAWRKAESLEAEAREIKDAVLRLRKALES